MVAPSASPGPSPCSSSTWNLHRTDKALKVALEHLESHTPCIAALQELPPKPPKKGKRAPWNVPAALADAELERRGLRRLGLLGSGRLALIASRDIERTTDPRPDGAQRMLAVTVKGAGWSGLHVIGFHAVDRITSPTDYGRGYDAALTRRSIDKFWTEGSPLVLLGDFNADPYSAEVSARKGLFAVRDRAEAKNYDLTHPHPPDDMQGTATIRPLYNPMWACLPEREGKAGGTLFLESEEAVGIRWRFCDQILLSRELIESIDGEPAILQRILTESTVKARGGRPQTKLSDHLPVEVNVKIEEVEECRAVQNG
jgi:endonuclease/exonuclease/phosphatase family metal-dependent hydrolase